MRQILTELLCGWAATLIALAFLWSIILWS